MKRINHQLAYSMDRGGAYTNAAESFFSRMRRKSDTTTTWPAPTWPAMPKRAHGKRTIGGWTMGLRFVALPP